MFNTPNFEEYARHVIEFYRGKPVVLQPFDYPMPTTAQILVGGNQPVSVKVAGNADFWLYGIDFFTGSGNTSLYGQFFDSGSQEIIALSANLNNRVVASEFARFVNAAGDPNFGGLLPLPRRIASNSTATITWSSAGPFDVDPVYSTLRGVLAFPQG